MSTVADHGATSDTSRTDVSTYDNKAPYLEEVRGGLVHPLGLEPRTH